MREITDKEYVLISKALAIAGFTITYFLTESLWSLLWILIASSYESIPNPAPPKDKDNE